MSRAARIGFLLILALAASPEAAFADGQVRFGPVFISPGHDRHDYIRQGAPYSRWGHDRHVVQRYMPTPYRSARGGPGLFVSYSSPRYYGYRPRYYGYQPQYYGYQPHFTHHGGRFCRP